MVLFLYSRTLGPLEEHFFKHYKGAGTERLI